MDTEYIRYKVNTGLEDTSLFYNVHVPYSDYAAKPSGAQDKQFYHHVFDLYTVTEKPVDLSETTSMFKGHTLTATSNIPRAINKPGGDWIAFIVIICLVILAMIRSASARRLNNVFRSAFYSHHLNQLEREGNLFNERLTLGMSVVYFSSLALLIYGLITSSPNGPVNLSGPELYALILAGTVLFVLIQMFIIRITGYIMLTRENAHAHELNILVFNHMSGVILFPVVVTALYMQSLLLLYVGLALVVVTLILRWLRIFSIGFTNMRYTIFYLFLYLCTLEILPLLLIIKTLGKI